MNYAELVDKRKKYPVRYNGFINQSQVDSGIYDIGNYLDPLGQWHNSIQADILIIGQDWGNKRYYLKNKGKDNEKNFTCVKLIELCKEAGITTGGPMEPFSNLKLHFANVIPFIREGSMSGNKDKNKGTVINDYIIKDCAIEFLTPLIDIVSPEIIIALGSSVYKALLYVFDRKLDKPYTDVVKSAPDVEGDIKIFPMFHCGAMGINFNRNLVEQKEDWSKLIPYINKLKSKKLINN